ncbi:MAG: histidine kinase, partial [Desulfuromonadales bacterium]|nr:histidine kinase [Desulfuromonadales bacterium]NIS42244.1 histidine kinase [Desulfuromonadales bacterium]
VRKRPGLENVGIILLSSVYNKAAYKRSPTSLHGADDYLEKHHISDQLIAKVRRLTAGSDGAAPSGPADKKGSGPADESRESMEEINSRVRQAEEHEVTPDAGDDVSLEKARRLARIIVSDIALYNEERVAEGIRSGNFYRLLESEIQEGRRLFAERVSEDIRRKRDLLQEAF